MIGHIYNKIPKGLVKSLTAFYHEKVIDHY